MPPDQSELKAAQADGLATGSTTQVLEAVPGPKEEESAVGALRCSLCHDRFGDQLPAGCPGCGTLIHFECEQELESRICPTLGCDSPVLASHGSRAGQVVGTLALALVLTLAADYLLYDLTAGCGVTVFACLIALATAWYRGRSVLRASPWVALWVALALGASLDASIFGRALLVILGWSVLATSLLPEEQPPLLDALLQGLCSGVRSLTAAPADLLRLARSPARFTRVAPLWVFAVPVALVVLFGILIVPANQILARWTTDLLGWLGSSAGQISFPQVLFWAVIALGTYGLFSFGRAWAPAFSEAPAVETLDDATRRHALLACTLSFAGLNALFLLANFADLLYLWLASQLPEGLSYAQFAHQGSYRLIAAVGLASVTVTALLPSGSLRFEDTWVRRLACAFLAQNLLVLAGAGKRLFLYVEAYGLTRFRVAVVLWLVLVAVGLALIVVRILFKKRILFLIRANAVSTVLLLAAVSFLNVDGTIAEWNVRRYERSLLAAEDLPGGGIDVEYLGSLESSALPALARLVEVARRQGDHDTSRLANSTLLKRIDEEQRRLESWQSWTWRGASSVREAQESLAQSRR